MGYNVSHFFFDAGCSPIPNKTCPVNSETIVKVIRSRNCAVKNSLITMSPPGATYFTIGR
jgi:hypothetical protein